MTLGALTAAGPLVTDMYLPGLPQMAQTLDTSETWSQMTMSVCLLGLALGQLVAGPWSDRVGRVRPLRWGVGVLAVTSLGCAVATTVEVLIAMRLLQGLAGAAAMVVARAMVRDVYQGARAAKVFSDLMLVMGLAPILGPLLGGQVLAFTDWRGIFVVLAGLGVLLAAASVAFLRETHRPAPGPRHSIVTALARAARTPGFSGHLAVAALSGAVLFTYLSMSPFVLQEHYGLGPVAYAWLFALNAAGMVIGSQFSARTVLRFGPARLLAAGVVVIATACASAWVLVLADAPLAAVAVSLWWVLTGLGLALGNNTALALAPHRTTAGSASALLGASQFLLGAAVAPLASVVGTTALTMTATMAVAGLLMAPVTFGLLRSTRRRAATTQAPA